MGEGLFPVGGDLAFDEPAGCGALGERFSSLVFPFSGAFVFDGADGQPQQFDHGVVGGEVSTVLSDFAQSVVQRFLGYLESGAGAVV